MKKVQDQIFYFNGEDRKVLENSPLVRGLVRKGYEVILADDPVDEYVFTNLRNYEEKVNISFNIEHSKRGKRGFQNARRWRIRKKETEIHH